MWLLRALRKSPAFPSSIAELFQCSRHGAPLQVELLDADFPRPVGWECCLRIRQATAAVFKVDNFDDFSFCLKESKVDYIPRPSRSGHPPKVPGLSDQGLAALQGTRGSMEESDDLTDYFFAALLWTSWRKHLPLIAEVLPKSRCPQFAAIRYGIAEQAQGPAGPASWKELATMLLLLILQPSDRAKSEATTFDPKATRALAGLESCVICSLELHAAVCEPLGPPDFDYVADGPFFHRMARRKKIDLGKWPADVQSAFNILLRGLLTSLVGCMKPQLRGTAHGRDGQWVFSSEEPLEKIASVASQADGGAEKRAKALRKKLADIAKLEAKHASGSPLSEAEATKVSSKSALQEELDALSVTTKEPDILDIWGIL